MRSGLFCVVIMAALSGCLAPRPTNNSEDGGGASGSGGAGGGSTGGGHDGGAGTGGASGAGGASGTGGHLGSGGAAAGGAGMGGSTGAGGMVLGAPTISGATTKDFSNVPVGTASAPFSWVIRNATGAASTGFLEFENDDAQEVSFDNGCTAPLAGGASCTVSVTFTPHTTGPRTGTLIVSAFPGGSITLVMSATGTTQVTVTTVGTGTVTSVPAGISCPGTCSATFGVQSLMFQARTTNGSNSVFSSWSDAACPGLVRDCNRGLSTATFAITATFATMNANLIFGTKQAYATSLGGAAPYDAACNTAATAAGINTSAGTGYIAWLSGQTSSAASRLGNASGWVRLDGLPFAATQAGLLTNHQVFYPFQFLDDGSPAGFTSFATGTNPDGTANINSDCNNWTSVSNSLGAVGGTADGGPNEWSGSISVVCGQAVSLICMGITKTATVTVPAPGTGRKIWLSNTLFTPSTSTTPDLACQTGRPAGVTSGAALIATTMSTTADTVLVPATSYYRHDGAFVGTGNDLIAAGNSSFTQLSTGIWQTGDGKYPVDSTAWTGSSAIQTVGTLATTCGNWTDPNQFGDFGSFLATLDNFWISSVAPAPCSNALRLYCVQTVP